MAEPLVIAADIVVKRRFTGHPGLDIKKAVNSRQGNDKLQDKDRE